MNRKPSPSIEKVLIEKGYYQTSAEQRINSGKECLDKLRALRNSHSQYFKSPCDQRGDLN